MKLGYIYIPVIAWGRARAGSNFDDDEERTHAGMNGIGSFATVVFLTATSVNNGETD